MCNVASLQIGTVAAVLHGVQANGGLLSTQIGESLAHERYLWSGDYDKSPEHACPAADVLLQVR